MFQKIHKKIETAKLFSRYESLVLGSSYLFFCDLYVAEYPRTILKNDQNMYYPLFYFQIQKQVRTPCKCARHELLEHVVSRNRLKHRVIC